MATQFMRHTNARPDAVVSALVALELFVAVLAMAGGTLLIVAPDGSLLDAHLSALRRTPFTDWRWPGVLLLVLVGFGFVLAAAALWTHRPRANALSEIAGSGLIAFEAVELIWLGYQPLQLLLAGMGAVVVVLAARNARNANGGHAQ